jgi:hypothetical protein
MIEEELREMRNAPRLSCSGRQKPNVCVLIADQERNLSLKSNFFLKASHDRTANGYEK